MAEDDDNDNENDDVRSLLTDDILLDRKHHKWRLWAVSKRFLTVLYLPK